MENVVKENSIKFLANAVVQLMSNGKMISEVPFKRKLLLASSDFEISHDVSFVYLASI